ncbi:MAG: hypothetical protein MSC55_01605 [Faecalibacterium sp.]|nr:hypothetical protein [Faecalibacterium sp.]MDD7570921.1 hypothetical protein [Faecalibacterium sp.]
MNLSEPNSACLHAMAIMLGQSLSEGLTPAEIKTLVYFLSLVSEYLTSLLPKCK